MSTTKTQKLEQILLKSTSLTKIQVQHLLQTKNQQGKNLEESLKNKTTAGAMLLELCKHLNSFFFAGDSFCRDPL